MPFQLTHIIDVTGQHRIRKTLVHEGAGVAVVAPITGSSRDEVTRAECRNLAALLEICELPRFLIDAITRRVDIALHSCQTVDERYARTGLCTRCGVDKPVNVFTTPEICTECYAKIPL